MWRMGMVMMKMTRTLSQAMTRVLSSSLPGTSSTAAVSFPCPEVFHTRC